CGNRTACQSLMFLYNLSFFSHRLALPPPTVADVCLHYTQTRANTRTHTHTPMPMPSLSSSVFVVMVGLLLFVPLTAHVLRSFHVPDPTSSAETNRQRTQG